MITKKQQIKTLVFMLMLFVALISIFSIKTKANAASTLSSAVMRQNASSSPVSCNASNGKLPSSATSVNAGSSLYFNMQVDNSIKVKKADLYMKKPGQSSYYRVYTESVSGYMRYTYTKQSVGSNAGTLYYYWKLTFTNGTVKTLSTSNITVKAVTSSAVIRQNASSSPVSCNASNGKLPSSATSVNAGSFLYFNMQVDNSIKVRKADLYMKKPGQSSYCRVYTESVSGYMRYTYTKQSVGSNAGTLYYYWKLTFTNGTVKTLSTSNITVKAVTSSAVIRQNASSSPVSCNASNGKLPSSATSVNAGSYLYFNMQVDNSIKVKKADLYMKKPGQSSYYRVYTESVSGYMRYTYTKQSVGSNAGTLYYYWKLTFTNGTVKTLSTSNITVKAVTSSAVIRQNASSSPVSCNASNGKLPSSASSVNAGSSLYFNMQVDNSIKVKKADLYMKKPGQSSYYRVYTESASGYMRYTYTKQSVGSNAGTLYYYWKLTFTNGTVKILSTSSITVKAVNASPTNQYLVTDAEIKAKASEYGIAVNTNAFKALQSINTKYGATLKSNKSGTNVFLFEGCGNNSNSDLRLNAMCVVIKNGKIVYINRNSSTIPDYPFSPYTNDNDDNIPTMKSGVYSFTTVNHRGKYAALNITGASVIRFTSKTNFYSGTSDDINVHRRSSNTPIYSTLPNSSGCILVGKSGTSSSSEYAGFIKALGIVGASATGESTYSNKITGKIVIDRTFASSYLSSVGYSSSAINSLG